MSLQEILNLVQIFSLVIITGGTLVIGALVAPSLFNNLSREEAGTLMVEVFGKFASWIKVSAILIALTKLVEFIYVAKFSFFITTGTGEEVTKLLNSALLNSTILALAIVAISLHIAMNLSPAIVEAYENDSDEFSKLHKQSEVLHRVNFVLGAIMLLSCI